MHKQSMRPWQGVGRGAPAWAAWTSCTRAAFQLRLAVSTLSCSACIIFCSHLHRHAFWPVATCKLTKDVCTLSRLMCLIGLALFLDYHNFLSALSFLRPFIRFSLCCFTSLYICLSLSSPVVCLSIEQQATACSLWGWHNWVSLPLALSLSFPRSYRYFFLFVTIRAHLFHIAQLFLKTIWSLQQRQCHSSWCFTWIGVLYEITWRVSWAG